MAAASRLHVLMLTWEYPPRIVGGLSRHVHELSTALARSGVRVDVITASAPEAPSDEERRFPLPTGRGDVRVHRAPSDPIEAPDFPAQMHQLNHVLVERALTAGFGRRPPDIIHGHDWLVGFAAKTLKHGLGRPLVATIHATEWGRNQGLHTPLQHYIHSQEWMLTYEAWRVICCSRFMADQVHTVHAVPADKLRVVANGIALDRLEVPAAAGDPAEFRRRFAEPNEKIVLFVGRLVREKGVEVLLEAAPRVLARRPEAVFVMVGNGWTEPLRQQTVRLGVRDRVRFSGFIPDSELNLLYRVADVAVYPSLYEPFGIVALEAMATRTPVVTSDVGGFRETITHGETGLHTWANNPESLAWGIVEVLEHPAAAGERAEKAFKVVVEQYSWDHLAARTVDIYREVLG